MSSTHTREEFLKEISHQLTTISRCFEQIQTLHHNILEVEGQLPENSDRPRFPVECPIFAVLEKPGCKSPKNRAATMRRPTRKCSGGPMSKSSLQEPQAVELELLPTQTNIQSNPLPENDQFTGEPDHQQTVPTTTIAENVEMSTKNPSEHENEPPNKPQRLPADPEVKPKRGRGRPRKVQGPTQDTKQSTKQPTKPGTKKGTKRKLEKFEEEISKRETCAEGLTA
eukprot:c15618_g1_i1.p1 GENE.c15618_g1_i1~~c15618_g1_i1.p1  ORF type:complete len:226 (+),score=19.95 c15618_g1_i1:548-1225(+)